jgi:hypothetical protein
VTDVRVDHGVTSGTFTLEGETFDVENNIWVVGNDADCLIIDAPHDVSAVRPALRHGRPHRPPTPGMREGPGLDGHRRQ